MNEIRRQGFTCPEGQKFAPNPEAMKFDCRLWRASVLHSRDMAEQDYFAHTSQDGRSPWERAEAQGIRATGESIAWGSPSAQVTFDEFMSCDPHCRNILNPSFMVAAVGYAPGGSLGHYWTDMFASCDEVDTSCYPPPSSLLLQLHHAPAPLGGQEKAKIGLGDAWSLDDCANCSKGVVTEAALASSA